MSLITAIYPSIFDWIGLMEKFHPRINLRWQLARILVLYLLNMYTLMIALYNKIQDTAESSILPVADGSGMLQGCRQNATSLLASSALNIIGGILGNDSVQAPRQDTPTRNCTQSESEQSCWETMIGQVIFERKTVIGQVIFDRF